MKLHTTAQFNCASEQRFWPQYKVEHLFYFSPGAVSRLEKAGELQRVALCLLRKRLPLDYLLSVACEFGPEPTWRFFRVARRIIPSALGRIRVPLMLGESLWIATRKAI